MISEKEHLSNSKRSYLPRLLDLCFTLVAESRLSLTVTILLATVMLFSGNVGAETYRWTDTEGNFHFTDDSTAVPRSNRSKITVEEDITLASPDVRKDVDKGRQNAFILEQEKLRLRKKVHQEENESQINRNITLDDIEFTDFDVFWSINKPRGKKCVSVKFLYKNVSQNTIGPFSTKMVLSQNGAIIEVIQAGDLPIRKPKDRTQSTGQFELRSINKIQDGTVKVDYYLMYDNVDLLVKTTTLSYNKFSQ